jgi:3-oxoadipate enol-lactonase
MQVLTDDGVRIEARVDGRGHARAVVLIHGFPFTHAIWDAQMGALARTSCVVSPDLRGAGKSSSPEGPYLMERLAADVAALLDILGIERASLVGHSMGGYVALAFARMFTERVARLGLIASRLRADTPEEAAARQRLAQHVESDGSVEPVIEAYLPRLFAGRTATAVLDVVARAYEIARENAPAGTAATLRGAALRAASDDIAQDLDVPVLVIAGVRDRIVDIEEARSVAARFPRARLMTCDDSGHLPMLEEPERVTEALELFLADDGEVRAPAD